MNKCTVIAKLTATPGNRDELERALKALIVASEEEPGTEIYSFHSDPNSEGTFYFFELYSDEAALAVHGSGPQMTTAIAALAGLMEADPEIVIMDPIAGKGLDL